MNDNITESLNKLDTFFNNKKVPKIDVKKAIILTLIYFLFTLPLLNTIFNKICTKYTIYIKLILFFIIVTLVLKMK